MGGGSTEGPSGSAEKQVFIVLAIESSRLSPNTQGRAEHLTAAPPFRFRDATCHPPGIAGDVAETSSNTQRAFRQLWKKYGGVFIGRETHVHRVVPGGPRGSERSRQKAERLTAAPGHLVDDMIALLRQRNTSTLCWPLEAWESP